MAAGTMTQFRGKMFASEVYNQARATISSVFSKVEQNRDVIVPDAIRLFLPETVIESLNLRHSDWAQTPYNTDPGAATQALSIAQQIDKSLNELLSNADAEPTMSNGKAHVTFVGILNYIHEHWCGIFPFCR